jgi:starch phosphorylase
MQRSSVLKGSSGAQRVCGVRASGRLGRALAVQPRAIAEAQRAVAGSSSTPAAADIDAKLRYGFGKAEGPEGVADAYLGTAWSVRERLIDSFDKTHEYWK